jgi:hypothetical protein
MDQLSVFSLECKRNRSSFFLRFCVITIGAVLICYVLHEFLIISKVLPSLYLKIIFMWEMLVISVFTPFVVQRTKDIGLSGWRVIISPSSQRLRWEFMQGRSASRNAERCRRHSQRGRWERDERYRIKRMVGYYFVVFISV